MRVAYFSPMPPERTGVADYSALLLPALRERLDMTVVRKGSKRAPRGTEAALYHVGNNPDAHAWIVDALRRRPGVVVLHDFVVHHLVAGMTIGRRDGHGYLDTMEREHGVVGRLLGARSPRQAHRAALGVPARGVSARLVRARARDRADRPFARRARARSPSRVRRPGLGRPASGLAGADGRASARRSGAGRRLLRSRQREQAGPGAPARVRRGPRGPSRGGAAPRRPDVARVRPRPQAPAPRPRRRRARPRGLGGRRSTLGADGRGRRLREPAPSDDG